MKAEHEVEEIEHTEPDDTNVGLITTITLVGACLVVAIAAALTALVRSEAASYNDEVGGYANLGQVRRLKIEQSRKLNSDYAWVDGNEKKLVALPIERAKELVSSEIKKDPELATPPKPEGALEGESSAAGDAGAASGPSQGVTASPHGEEAPTEGVSYAEGVSPSGGQGPSAAPAEGGQDGKLAPKKGANPSPAAPSSAKAPAPKLAPAPTRAPPAVPAPAPAPPTE